MLFLDSENSKELVLCEICVDVMVELFWALNLRCTQNSSTTNKIDLKYPLPI